MANRADRRLYEFGQFRLDPTGRVLFRSDQAVSLPPKAADTLLLLVQNAGNVVEKQELLKRVWQDAFVEEGSLTRTISILRKALAAGENRQECIATISKCGYRFMLPVKEIPTHWALAGEKTMLAVLPFENLSGDSTQEYFSDGLTEEMITQLGRLNPERLGIIARTSAMQYKGTSKSLHRIGEELQVRYIMEGSVRRSSGRVRIAAQLIQVSDQTHLWAESYERELGDILKLQSDVAESIARQIQIKLIPREKQRLATPATVLPEAYEAYLQGRYLWNHVTRQSLWQSLRHFEKAVQIDPAYAAAYAGMADSYLRLQDEDHLPTLEAIAKAKRAASKALHLDEMLAEPHVSLAHTHFHEFNWQAAEKEFQRGIELNSSYATAHFYYANYLLTMERFDEAIVEARRAQVLDPISVRAGSNATMALYYASRYDEAIQEALQVLASDPKFARTYEDLGRAYLQKRMGKEAIAALEKAVALTASSPRYQASLAHAYAIVGKRKRALHALKKLREFAAKTYVSPYAFALVETGLGHRDQAFAWLDKAYEERSSALPFVKVDQRLASLHSDSRFHSLLRRLGLQS